MKPFWILVICILAYSDFPSDNPYADYGMDFESAETEAPKDPPSGYFTDEPATRTVADASGGADSERDPGLNGGTTEPAGDESVAETSSQEKPDFLQECMSKGYAAEQCCETCVQDVLVEFGSGECSNMEDCERQHTERAEEAAREGSEQRSPAGSESEGVGVGN